MAPESSAEADGLAAITGVPTTSATAAVARAASGRRAGAGGRVGAGTSAAAAAPIGGRVVARNTTDFDLREELRKAVMQRQRSRLMRFTPDPHMWEIVNDIFEQVWVDVFRGESGGCYVVIPITLTPRPHASPNRQYDAFNKRAEETGPARPLDDDIYGVCTMFRELVSSAHLKKDYVFVACLIKRIQRYAVPR